MMPNLLQAAFLASFFATLTSLIVLSHILNSKLKAAGYDFSQLILLGLPKDTPNDSPASVPGMADILHSVKILFLENLEGIAPASILSTPVIFAAVAVLGTFFYAFLFKERRASALDPTVWKEYPLIEKTQISPNTANYRFKLPSPKDVLGLPIGQHISVSAEINGKVITRSYTPVSSDDDVGYFDLLIKTYEKGNISRYISLLNIGDKLRIKGPKGNFTYNPQLCSHLSMIAGGSGITPMIQIIRAILKNDSDNTTISLIYANVNLEDILLKDDLDALRQTHPKWFKLYYVLNNPPANWTGGVGFVTKEHIMEHLQNPALGDSKLLICGPPPMITAMKRNLEELNFPSARTVSKFEDKVYVF